MITVSRVCAVLLFIPLFAVLVPAAELTWSDPVVFPIGTTVEGDFLDLTASENGDFHMIYCGDLYHTINYARETGGTWSDCEYAYSFGDGVECRIDMATWENEPLVSYSRSDTREIASVHRNGADDWSSSVPWPETNLVYRFEKSLDSFAHLHAIYTSVNYGTELMYCSNTGGLLVHEQIDFIDEPGVVIPVVSMKIDNANVPHFAWYDSDAGEVRYAVRTGENAFDVTTVAAVTDCDWVEAALLGGSIPLIGYIDRAAKDTIYYAIDTGSSFYSTAVVETDDPIDAADLAAATDEGPSTTNIYFIYAQADRLHYAYYEGADWLTEQINTVTLSDTAVEISAAWNAMQSAVGVGYRGDNQWVLFTKGGIIPTTPTPGPSATPSPEPSPEPSPTGSVPTATPTPMRDVPLEINLGPDMNYTAGDPMHGILEVHNPGIARNADIYLLLDVFGEYWFAPGWTHDIDFFAIAVPESDTTSIEFLPAFNLPDPLPPGGPFYFHAAAFTPETLDADTMVSNLDAMEFHFM